MLSNAYIVVLVVLFMILIGTLIVEYQSYQKKMKQMRQRHQDQCQQLDDQLAKSIQSPLLDHVKSLHQQKKAKELQQKINNQSPDS